MGITKRPQKASEETTVADTTAGGVPMLEKAIRVLNELAASEGAVTSSGLSRQLGISQPTCYRLLKTLEAADWIKRNEHDGYDFSMGLYPLAKRFIDLDRAGRTVQPVLENLSHAFGLTAKFSVRLGNQQTTVAVAQPMQAYNVTAPVGARFPVVWGAAGAALLSFLVDEEVEQLVESLEEEEWAHESADALRKRIKSVRKSGVCENIGNHPQGIDTVAAPLKHAKVASAISLVWLRGDIDKKNLGSVKQSLVEAANRASERLQ